MVRVHRLIGELRVSALHGPGPWGVGGVGVYVVILCFISAVWGRGPSRWWVVGSLTCLAGFLRVISLSGVTCLLRFGVGVCPAWRMSGGFCPALFLGTLSCWRGIVAPDQSPTSRVCLTGVGHLQCCLRCRVLFGLSCGLPWYFPLWWRPGPSEACSRGLGVELSVRADLFKVDLNTQREIL